MGAITPATASLQKTQGGCGCGPPAAKSGKARTVNSLATGQAAAGLRALGAGALSSSSTTDAARGATDPQYLRLPEGVTILVGAGVTQSHINRARKAIADLPPEDVQLLINRQVPIELHSGSHLRAVGPRSVVLGDARLVSRGSERDADRIRIAADGPSIEATIKHEIGHVVAWIHRGDSSEAAADEYMNRYSRGAVAHAH